MKSLTPLTIHKIQSKMLFASMRITPVSFLLRNILEGPSSSLVFETVTKEKIEKPITNSNIKKAVQSNDIPTKLVHEFGYLFSKNIATSINRCKTGSTFVNAFKKAEVRPIYKKDGRTEKSNYRPISVLSNVSKIYERCLYEQMYSYFDKIFSKNQCGFHKGFNTQHIPPSYDRKNESITR